MLLKKGTQVKIMTGKDRGKTGEVLEISKKKNSIKVKSINMVKKHPRKTKGELFLKKLFYIYQMLEILIYWRKIKRKKIKNDTEIKKQLW